MIDQRSVLSTKQHLKVKTFAKKETNEDFVRHFSRCLCSHNWSLVVVIWWEERWDCREATEALIPWKTKTLKFVVAACRAAGLALLHNLTVVQYFYHLAVAAVCLLSSGSKVHKAPWIQMLTTLSQSYVLWRLYML